jgi:hypothetical protein
MTRSNQTTTGAPAPRYRMLAPLPPGEHILYIHARLEAFDFELIYLQPHG